jgi:tripartite-type tricarboxylate transporter receptor subunit TctC
VADIAAPGSAIRLGVVTGGTNMMMSLIARDVLKLNVQVVRGYPAVSAIWLAMQRGEVDGQIIGLTSVLAEHPEFWTDKLMRPLVQFGRASRLDTFSEVPTARELARDPADRALVEFAELPFTTSLPFVAPPDLPADRAGALRQAFAAMVADAEFVEGARRRQVELAPIAADAITAALQRAAATPPEVIARLNAIVDSGR